MAANYQTVMADMQAAGLVLGGGLVVDSGKTIRVPIKGDREKRGRYRLSTVDIDGERYLVGAFGIWRDNDNGKVVVRPDRPVSMSHEQQPAIAAKPRADAAQAKAQRRPSVQRPRPARRGGCTSVLPDIALKRH
jgi:hypothetical protein